MAAVLFWALPVWADTLRVATFNTELSRKGPGLLLRDILKGSDPQITAVMDLLVQANADVIALQGFDYDLENRALNSFADTLEKRGLYYPHRFAVPSNAGLQIGLDLNGDGRLGGPDDAQGYGRFYGAGSMALLSRFAIDTARVQDFSPLLWRDLPGADLPQLDGNPFPSADAQAVQRLSSRGHWVVPILHPEIGSIPILTFHATPPVFDGPEDRNGKRNADEIRFWQHFLNGEIGQAPSTRFVLMGDANIDPNKGAGRRDTIRALLDHSAFQDPLPEKPTVNWPQTGPMRVSYILPSAGWRIIDAQVMPQNAAASRHNLLWVDLKQ
ncbi:endonuclease/exonuclease/phosphatase family protein [Sulfitobacter mediterraneus]|uniref:endonuclease/exonuclease/phosphatase family protein n=1 Tax=Sulfitobacter mediterraneus TaxID=83219 RepID=UPI0023AEEDE7|nr:endonuclease/exonuclease/phosphatase family protein [Sulfitobacter mediterraneus]